jgi:hypothetical protein
MPFRYAVFNLLTEEVYYAVGPERKLTLFHVGWLLIALAGVGLGTVHAAARLGWMGLVVGPVAGLIVGWITGGLFFWAALFAVNGCLRLLYRRGWFTLPETGCPPIERVSDE